MLEALAAIRLLLTTANELTELVQEAQEANRELTPEELGEIRALRDSVDWKFLRALNQQGQSDGTPRSHTQATQGD